MVVDLVIELVAQPMDRLLQGVVRERRHAAAIVADQVVMVMLPVRQRRLEPRRCAADVESLNQLEFLEELQRSIHGRNPDAAPGRPELVGDVGRAENAVLAADRLEHRGAWRAGPVARPLERALGVLDPLVRGRSGD